MVDAPHRHRATVARRRGTGRPASSTMPTSPRTRIGPSGQVTTTGRASSARVVRARPRTPPASASTPLTRPRATTSRRAPTRPAGAPPRGRRGTGTRPRRTGCRRAAPAPAAASAPARSRPGDLLVHRVGLDVLVEVQGRAGVEPVPPEPVAVEPVRQRGGHLERGEVPHDRAAQPPVQAEQGHDVERREGHRRHLLDVRAVERVEPRAAHRAGEQLAVHPVGRAAAVLVRLDLHERGLRAADQARDRPGVRVGLPQLVDGAVDEQLESCSRVARRATNRATLGPGDGAVIANRASATADRVGGTPLRHRDAARAAPPRRPARSPAGPAAATGPTPSRRRRRRSRRTASS